MDREALWKIFEDTGSVEVYLLYRDILNEQGLPESEEPRNADIYGGSSAQSTGR
ncbi:MAG: YqzL family protein [Acetanaerobacterium sp.]